MDPQNSSSEPERGKYRDRIAKLLVRHAAYFDHIVWPKFGTEEWEDLVTSWTEAFGEQRYHPGRVEKAMRELQRKPPEFKTQHLPEIIRLIEDQNGNHARGSNDHSTDNPNAPKCEYCEGDGFTRAYRSDYTGKRDWFYAEQSDGSRKVIALAVRAPCVCAKGREIWANWVLNKVGGVDLTRLPRDWSLHDPTAEPIRKTIESPDRPVF